MPITYERLIDFVARHGNVRIYPAHGVKVLKSGEIDFFDLIKKSQRFGFRGKIYSRAVFEKIIDKKSKEG